MKTCFSFILILFILQTSIAQENIYHDQNGQEITNEAYNKIRQNKDLLLSSWQYVDKNGIKHHAINDRFQQGVFNYNEIKTQLETVINRKIPTNDILLIKYYYKDDLYAPQWDNKWTRSELHRLKDYRKPLLPKLKENNITYIALFEEGIILKNKPDNENEYFFTDQGNNFRKQFFTMPALCGSYAIIKPNGQSITRNGEYDPEMMIQFLEDDNWSIFFKAGE